MFTVGSLFAGIGGLDLGLERAGFQVSWQVETDDYATKVLESHWPDVARFRDVRDCGAHNLEPVDLVCGGFPCQPFSAAGEQRGEQDDRNLWPEMRRIIDELRPDWALAENVPGIRNIYLDTILSDLESLDYTAATLDLPAVAFGAHHIRHRFFIVAHAKSEQAGVAGQPRRQQCVASVADAHGTARDWRYSDVQMGRESRTRKAERVSDRKGIEWPAEPRVHRIAYGVPNRLERARCLGNAVVPQVAEWIGRRILESLEGIGASSNAYIT